MDDLIDAQRASDAWPPALSLVALEVEGEIVGGADRSDPVSVIAVVPDPDHRRRVIGPVLMHAVLGAEDEIQSNPFQVGAAPTEQQTVSMRASGGPTRVRNYPKGATG